MDSRRPDDPRSVAQAAKAELVRAVERAIEGTEPELVLTVGSDGLTSHPEHIAVHDAVATASRDPRRSSSRVLGARVRRADVERGQRLLGELLDEQPAGSGRMRGSSSVTLTPIDCPPAAARLHQQALDCYYPDLATTPLSEFLANSPSRGDSVLLRAIFDVGTWARDYYEKLR